LDIFGLVQAPNQTIFSAHVIPLDDFQAADFLQCRQLLGSWKPSHCYVVCLNHHNITLDIVDGENTILTTEDDIKHAILRFTMLDGKIPIDDMGIIWVIEE
jgi:hypothetical protein